MFQLETAGLTIVKKKVEARFVNNKKPQHSSLQLALVNSRKKPSFLSLVLNAFTPKKKLLNLKMRIEKDPELKNRIDTLYSSRIKYNFTIKMRVRSWRVQKYYASIGLNFHPPSAIIQLQQLLFKYDEPESRRNIVREICSLYIRFWGRLPVVHKKTPMLLPNGPSFVQVSQVKHDPTFNLVSLNFVGVIAFSKMLMKVFSKFWIPKHHTTPKKTEERSSTIHVHLVGVIASSFAGDLKKAFTLFLLFFVGVIKFVKKLASHIKKAFTSVLLFFVGVTKFAKKKFTSQLEQFRYMARRMQIESLEDLRCIWKMRLEEKRLQEERFRKEMDEICTSFDNIRSLDDTEGIHRRRYSVGL